MERLPVLTEEVLRIGSDMVELQSDDDTSERDAALSSSDSDQIDIASSSQEKKIKSIEEYQRPLAVMGVSVL